MKSKSTGPFSFLVGQECWGVVAGTGSGSVVELFLGNKIPRSRPIFNDTLSAEIRENDPQFSVFIQCSWRLSTEEEIVCSSAWSSNIDNGQMLTGLARLNKQTVAFVELMPKTLDLFLGFENSLLISVFNDCVMDESDVDSSYWISQRDVCYSVRRFKLTTAQIERNA